jgi:uncharacterized protein
MITGDKKTVIGMVHIGALPGTPSSGSSVAQLTEIAVGEAILLSEAGFDAVMLENMHDVPYLNRKVGPEIIAAMTAVSYAVRQAVSLPIGIQVLAGANMAALAIALACELDFIRAEAYIFSQISDEGFMTGDAAELLRYRRRIGAEKIKIFCDIKKNMPLMLSPMISILPAWQKLLNSFWQMALSSRAPAPAKKQIKWNCKMYARLYHHCFG